MDESELTLTFASEASLDACARTLAQRWRDAGCRSLLVGLAGELGSGKTTWARAMLRGLDYERRVPSPTYTLMEHYALRDLDVVHLDLYRLQDAAELENLGVRDWLGRDGAWILVEWPERATVLERQCDIVISLELTGSESRRVTLAARSAAGREAIRQASLI